MQIDCMEGFEFKIIWENQEEDVRKSVIEGFKNNCKYFGALDIPPKDNIKKFIKSFDEKFSSLLEVENFIKEKSRKYILIISDIDKMVSKEQESFINFIENIKTENISVLVIEKNIETVRNSMKMAFKHLVTDEYVMPKTNFYDIPEYLEARPIERFIYYSIFGTNKRYIENINFQRVMKQNIIEMFLKKEAVFANESRLILKEELRSLQVYNVILQAIARGAETLIEISKELDLPTSVCNKYTTVLLEQGVLIKIRPVYSNDTRKSKYKIRNSLLNFIYYFIFDNVPLLKLDKAEDVYNEKIGPQINSFLATRFLDLCSDYIEKFVLSNKVENIGCWWDKFEKIDIVAGDNLEAVVADCFWQNDMVGVDKLDELRDKAGNLDLTHLRYYLFSKAGFTEELKRIAHNNNDILLVEFKDMFGTKEDKNKKKFFFSRNK